MQLLKASKCCGFMNLRTGGLVIGYLNLFFAFSNLEAPAQLGVGPFGMYQVISVLFILVKFLFEWNSFTFSGNCIGIRHLDLWHHECKSIWFGFTDDRTVQLNEIKISFIFRVTNTETNELDATRIDCGNLWNDCAFLLFNFSPVARHGISWKSSILFG